MNARTLFEKIWDAHVVAEEPGRPAVLYVDLHLVHEVTSPQAFAGLARAASTCAARTARSRRWTTRSRRSRAASPSSTSRRRSSSARSPRTAASAASRCTGPTRDKQGIVHVIGPELGLTQPGMTIVCGDSHTSTHGAFGALAFGIGTSEVEHVLATQCLLQHRAKTLEVRVDGALRPGVTAKDVILALIARIGVGGATGHVIEYTGAAIRALDMEGRMTVCNMSIEAGARAGLIAPDDVTFAYLEGREHAPKGADWDAAVARWRELRTDDGATFDRTIVARRQRDRADDHVRHEPRHGHARSPGACPRPPTRRTPRRAAALEKALRYMDLAPGEPLLGRAIDVVFIGSCTNSRIGDLRAAAHVMSGRKVARRRAGARRARLEGGQARRPRPRASTASSATPAPSGARPGCSMCIAMNGDQLEPGQYAVSTSNRNFEGRQGRGGRTFLASPLTAAAAAVTGRITDVRTLL